MIEIGFINQKLESFKWVCSASRSLIYNLLSMVFKQVLQSLVYSLLHSSASSCLSAAIEDISGRRRQRRDRS
jgi:hypothetical protein